MRVSMGNTKMVQHKWHKLSIDAKLPQFQSFLHFFELIFSISKLRLIDILLYDEKDDEFAFKTKKITQIEKCFWFIKTASISILEIPSGR